MMGKWRKALIELQEWRKRRKISLEKGEKGKYNHPDPESVFDFSGYAEKFPDHKVLDIGCGDGRFGEIFKNYTGIDPMPISSADNIIKGIGERLPFPDKSFDLIISISVLSMSLDPIKFLLEIARIAKPSATIYLSVCLIPEPTEINITAIKTIYELESLLEKAWVILAAEKKYTRIPGFTCFTHLTVAYVSGKAVEEARP